MNGKALGAILGVGALFFFMRRKNAGGVMNRVETKKQLSKNFNLSEFLQSSTFPELAYYKPGPEELANVTSLVENVLQPMRNTFPDTPVIITSGARPQNIKVDGKSLDDALRDKGYDVAENSDHHGMNAADFTTTDKSWLPKMFEYLKHAPHVRQVILYYKLGVPNHIHVASVRPGSPAFTGDKFAYVVNAPKPVA